jgi:chemotaxis signal transduction protein
MSPTISMAGSSAAGRAALQRVGLVVCEVSKTVVGIHIPNVARVLDTPPLLYFPRPRSKIVALARVEAGLVPVLDMGLVLGAGKTENPKFMVLVEDKEAIFGFLAERIESVLQIRADRVHFPRVGDVAVDPELLRGYWKFSARRNGYIIHASRLYRKVVGEPRKTELPASEIEA